MSFSWIHGHLENCPITKGCDEESKNFLGQKLGVQNRSFQRQMRQLVKEFGIRPENIIVWYECQFRLVLEKEPSKLGPFEEIADEIQTFVREDEEFCDRPLERLNCRKAMMGGRCKRV